MAIISPTGISDLVNDANSFLKTNVGRKAMANQIAPGAVLPTSDAMKIAEDLKRMLIVFAESEFTLSQFSVYQHINNITIGNPVDKGDGTFEIGLDLYGDLSRPSLLPGNRGTDNIVSMFIHGWDDKNGKLAKMFGIWHGRFTRARTHKDGMSFASDAIDQFNNKYSSIGATARLGDEYI